MKFTKEENSLLQEALVMFYEDALLENHCGSYDRETEVVNNILEKIGYGRIVNG